MSKENNFLELDGGYAFEIGYSLAEVHVFLVLGYLSRQCPYRLGIDFTGVNLTPGPLQLNVHQGRLLSKEIETTLKEIDEIKNSIEDDIIYRDKPDALKGLRGIKCKSYPNKGIFFYRRASGSQNIPLLSENLKQGISALSDLKKQVEGLGRSIGACFDLGLFVGILDKLAEANRYFSLINEGGRPKSTPTISCYLYHFLNLLKKDPSSATINAGSPLFYVKKEDNITNLIFEAPGIEELWMFPGEPEFLKKGIKYSKLKFPDSFQHILDEYLFDDKAPKSPELIELMDFKNRSKEYCQQILPESFQKPNVLELHLLTTKKSRCVYWKGENEVYVKVTLGKEQTYSIVEYIIDNESNKQIVIQTGKEKLIVNFPDGARTSDPDSTRSKFIDKFCNAGVGIKYSERENSQKNRIKGFSDWLKDRVSTVFITIE